MTTSAEMLNLIILFLLSKTQNYIFMSSLYQQKTIKNHQNSLAKNLKDQCIWSEHKTKVKIKTQQMSIDIS